MYLSVPLLDGHSYKIAASRNETLAFTAYLLNPDRRAPLAASICVSSSPESTAAFTASSVLIRSWASAASIAVLPLASSSTLDPQRTDTHTRPESATYHQGLTRLGSVTVSRSPVSASHIKRFRVSGSSVTWLCASCNCSHTLVVRLFLRVTTGGRFVGDFALVSLSDVCGLLPDNQ